MNHDPQLILNAVGSAIGDAAKADTVGRLQVRLAPMGQDPAVDITVLIYRSSHTTQEILERLQGNQ